MNVGRFANILRRFANMFSPILMAHCRDSKLSIAFLNVTTFGFLNLVKKLGNLKFETEHVSESSQYVSELDVSETTCYQSN